MSAYEHFRQEERPLIERFLDWKEEVSSRYLPKLTVFLDPRQQHILRTVIGENDEVGLAFSGGYAQAERKRALLFPPYSEVNESDFELSFFEVDYPIKFASLSHRELLGALIGTGIDRNRLGDLIFSDGRVQFIAASEVEPYLSANLTSVGRTSVTIRTVDRASLIHREEQWQEYEGTVSSLRLDTVLSEIYRLSRSKTAESIAHGYAKVNWKIEDRKDAELHEGDTLSLRGQGRSKLLSLEGLTKKHKIRLRYGKLK